MGDAIKPLIITAALFAVYVVVMVLIQAAIS